MHQRRGAAKNVLVVRTAIRTVKVEIRRLHTRCKGIRLLVIVVGNEEAQVTGVERHAVLQIGLGAVVIHKLDGVNDRSGDVLIVCTVNHAQIVQNDVTLEVALVQLHAVRIEPARALGIDHGAEQHTAIDPNLRTGILGQISLQILPPWLERIAFRILCVRLAEVDVCRGPALTAVNAGGDLGTKPGDGNALGNVDPHAQSSGSTADVQIIAQAEARAVGTGQAGPVILQLDGIVAEADDIGKFLISIGHHGALHHATAASVVIRRHGVGRHAGKALHGGADGGIVPGVLVAAVQNHRRLHADVHRDGSRQVAARGGDDRAARILHVSGDGEQVSGERAGALVGNAPGDVAVLEVDRLGLIGGLEAQIADFVVVQVRLSGGKRQLVRLLDVQHSRTDCSITADQLHRHITGLAGRGKGCRSAAAAHGGLADRAHGLIADGKGHALRQGLSRCAGEVHGVRRQGDGRTGGIIRIVGGNGSVIKLTGSRHGGYHQNGAGHRALAAAGRGVAHSQIPLALTLGKVCRGTALVQLNGCNTAESDHHSCLFFRRITHRARGHGTVSLEQNHSTVGLDTYAGTGIVAAVTGLGDNYLTVPDHSHQGVHSLHDLNGFPLLGTLVGLGLCQRRALLEDVDRAVIKRGDKGAAGVVVVHHAVHHQIAGGFAGIDVEPRSVDASHYVQSCLLFVDMGLIRGGFQGPALLLGVAVAVTGHDFGPASGGVDLHDVGNRLGVTGSGIRNDSRFLNIRRNRVVLAGCHIVACPVYCITFIQASVGNCFCAFRNGL